jgi:hypothetical protein
MNSKYRLRNWSNARDILRTRQNGTEPLPSLTPNLFSKTPAFLFLGLSLLLTACTSMPPSGKNFANFSDYAESVFRRQNTLSSRLMMLSEADLLPDNDSLEDNEQAMHEACHLLNEYAEMESSGEFINPLFARSVHASIESCDQRIGAMEVLINQLPPP